MPPYVRFPPNPDPNMFRTLRASLPIVKSSLESPRNSREAVSALADLGINWANIEDWGNLGTDIGTVFTDFNLGTIATLLGALLVGLIIIFVFFIISMYFLRKSLNQLSTKSGIGLFGTAGILVLIGAVIPVIGLLIIWIGFILATAAFFQMKKEEPKAQ